MGFGFGLIIALSLTAWGAYALSTGVDPPGATLLLSVGLGLIGFTSRGFWSVWTAACRSLAVSER